MKNIHILPSINPSGIHFYDYHITSNEEIKEGNWCVDDIGDVFKIEYLKYFKEFCKKIILTTDQDLIKDGVQAIDDEFLEWFVKNPSCEKVEVVDDWNSPRIDAHEYKIIIPKEELERGITITHVGKPKQETLEEFAEREATEFYKKGTVKWNKFRQLIEVGAKWQQERSYSEEEVEILLETLSKVLVYQGNEYKLPHYFEYEIKQVIEQFKKK